MSSIRNEIISLLKNGKSYKEICDILHVSKSTINYWFTRLDEETKNKIRIYRISNWKNSNKKNQKIRVEKILNNEKYIQNKNSKVIGELTKRELLLLGAGLYWAEGTKKDRWHLQFSNSDPFMVKLMMRFLRKVCLVPQNKFYMQVILHKNIKENDAKKYWSLITNIPRKQFKKACYSKSKASKNIRKYNSLPYGTLQIRVFNKLIVHKVYGYINGLKSYAGMV